MNLRLLFSAGLSLVFLQATAQTNTVGTIVHNPELTEGGYNLIYPHNQSNAYLIDMCGNVVHTWEHADSLRPANVLYLLDDSDVITTYRPAEYTSDPIWAGGGGASVARRTWDNTELWSFTRNDADYRLHHDVEPLPNGNVLVTAWEQRDSLACIQAGRNPANLTGVGMWSEVVWELKPNDEMGADIIWEWAVWDHMIQDFDETKDNFGVVSEHPELININFGMAQSAPADWLHINAIAYDAFSGHVMLSVPTFNEIWVVDKDNTTPGELKWRWGNPMAYDRGDSSDTKLGFQHHTHWLDMGLSSGNPDLGKVGVFNNRVQGETSEYSSVHTLIPHYDEYDNEYIMDIATGTFLPLDYEWTFESEDPNTIYSNIVSSFQRLENGNNLICSGKSGDTREYTPEGELVWHYKTPLLNAGGVASPVSQGTVLLPFQNLTFRAHRYAADHPAFNGIDFAVGEPIELDPTPLAACFGCDFTLILDSITIESTTADIAVSYTGSYDLGSLTWYDSDFILLDTLTLNLGGVSQGGYTLIATDVMGCSDTLVVTIIVDGINTPEPLVFGVYPNPSNGRVNLVSTSHLSNASVSVYDIQGRMVFSQNDLSNTALDLQGLNNGTYQLVVRTGTSVGTTRIVIQH